MVNEEKKIETKKLFFEEKKMNEEKHACDSQENQIYCEHCDRTMCEWCYSDKEHACFVNEP